MMALKDKIPSIQRIKYGHLAHGLGISVSHVERLIAKNPAFREAVGAYKPKGCKNWRIRQRNMPSRVKVLCDRVWKAVPKIRGWKQRAASMLCVCPSWHRNYRPAKKGISPKEVALEYAASRQLSRVISLLCPEALTSAQLGSGAVASVRKDFGKNLDWKIDALRLALIENKAGDEEADTICTMARLVATKYKKRLIEIPNFWKKYLQREKKKAVAWNKERKAIIKSHRSDLGRKIAIYQEAQPLLTELDINGHFENTVGSERQNAKIRAMGIEEARKQMESGQLSLSQDASVWPTTGQFEEHLKEVKKSYRINEIIRVIKELELEGITPTGKEIAPRYYRSPDAWRIGKGGIAVKYFQRALVQEWRAAKSFMEGTPLSDYQSDTSGCEGAGLGVARIKAGAVEDFDSTEEEEGRASKVKERWAVKRIDAAETSAAVERTDADKDLRQYAEPLHQLYSVDSEKADATRETLGISLERLKKYWKEGSSSMVKGSKEAQKATLEGGSKRSKPKIKRKTVSRLQFTQG
jgi:hypothetical protein